MTRSWPSWPIKQFAAAVVAAVAIAMAVAGLPTRLLAVDWPMPVLHSTGIWALQTRAAGTVTRSTKQTPA